MAPGADYEHNCRISEHDQKLLHLIKTWEDTTVRRAQRLHPQPALGGHSGPSSTAAPPITDIQPTFNACKKVRRKNVHSGTGHGCARRHFYKGGLNTVLKTNRALRHCYKGGVCMVLDAMCARTHCYKGTLETPATASIPCSLALC